MKWKKRDSLTDIKSVVFRNMNVSEEDCFIDEKRVFRIDGLENACNMIHDFIQNKEPIRIVGDYDADGVTSTSILYMALKSLDADVTYRLPRRISEGYGISEKIISEIDKGLVITVDNGIAAIDPIRKAKEKGLNVIVVDHHLRNDKGELPDADIIINPNALSGSAEFNGYCGAGLAYRLAETLIPDNKALLEKLVCFAAIGTVTDVMELKSENRRIVQHGLKNMTKWKSRTTGLGSIMSACEFFHITATDIAFKIGPMINAPGRLYDDGARISVESLIYDGKYDESIGKKLVQINEDRKVIVNDSYERVEEEISAQCMYGDAPLIVYVSELNEGIVGIIAGRLAEKYEVPAFVFTDTEDKNLIKGSGRSAREVHLKKLLDECSSMIYKYGGHAEAAGITLEAIHLDEFREMMQDKIVLGESSKEINEIEYDLEIDASQIKETFAELKKYEPFGNGNPNVVFKVTNYKLSPRYSNYYKLLGDLTHVKLFGVGSSAIWFGGAERYFALKEPKKVDMVGILSCSYFRDMPELQVEIIDLKDATEKKEKSALGKRLEELAKNRYK